MQLHDILLLRTSASLHSVSVGAKPLSTGQCAPCRRLYQMYAVKVYEAYITTRLKEKRIIMNKKISPWRTGSLHRTDHQQSWSVPDGKEWLWNFNDFICAICIQ